MKHCILEIAITALDQAVFASHHIMSVSGIEVKHRSKVIQGKLQRTKKGKCQKHSVNLFHWIMVALLLIRMKLAILKNNNFDNEVDQSSDDLLYRAAAET